MTTRVPTYKSAKHVPPDAPSALGMCRIAAHFLGLCSAGRHIGGKTVPLYAPLAMLMERIAAHFGLFSTNEPTIEPTKTQGIDERTRESDERTRNSANEPEVRLVAPQGPKAAPSLRFLDPSAGEGGPSARCLGPEKGDSPERPRPCLTPPRLWASIPMVRAVQLTWAAPMRSLPNRFRRRQSRRAGPRSALR
jgi:hypothetical protein